MLYIIHPRSKHQRLVPVVAAPHIPGLHTLRSSDLCQLLAISKNAKLGLAGQYLFPAEKTGFAARDALLAAAVLRIVWLAAELVAAGAFSVRRKRTRGKALDLQR